VKAKHSILMPKEPSDRNGFYRLQKGMKSFLLLVLKDWIVKLLIFCGPAGLGSMGHMCWRTLPMPEHIIQIINLGCCWKQLLWWQRQGMELCLLLSSACATESCLCLKWFKMQHLSFFVCCKSRCVSETRNYSYRLNLLKDLGAYFWQYLYCVLFLETPTYSVSYILKLNILRDRVFYRHYHGRKFYYNSPMGYEHVI